MKKIIMTILEGLSYIIVGIVWFIIETIKILAVVIFCALLACIITGAVVILIIYPLTLFIDKITPIVTSWWITIPVITKIGGLVSIILVLSYFVGKELRK